MLILIYSVLLSIIPSDVQSTFVLVSTPGGSPVCAVDSPSSTVSAGDVGGIPSFISIPGAVRCTMYCTTLGVSQCVGFNYLDAGQCQIYATAPNNCTTTSPGCRYYEISPGPAPMGCTVQRDVNECSTNNGGCDVNAACTNTVGSFTCTCRTGYSGDGFTCSALPGAVLGCIHTSIVNKSAWHIWSAAMTHKTCTNYCLKQGMPYAALLARYMCWCINDYASEEKRTNCNYPCSGDKTQICGGPYGAITVVDARPPV